MTKKRHNYLKMMFLMVKYIEKGRRTIQRYRTIVENMSWVTIVELFMLMAPLITYPYLVKVLGMNRYGLFITAQVLTSYATIIIDFGSNFVVAKHVSINRSNKKMLSEIVCSVFAVRGFLWVMCLPVYCLIIMSVSSYREEYLLFMLTYGLTLNDVLFPRYFFQGIEKMRVSSLINIGIKLSFILLVFIFVRVPDDYLLVPVLYTIGYALAGIVSMFIIFRNMKIPFSIPSVERMMIYVKDSSSIFATDLVCTIKDKFNYFLVGNFVGMSEVVVYDLGSRLNAVIAKPYGIICTVMFPRLAKNKSMKQVRIVAILSLLITFCIYLIVNIFLKDIAFFFLHEDINLFPLRVLLVSPVILSISYVIANNIFVAFGYNRYVFYSIVVTTSVYLLTLLVFWATDNLNSILSFVYIAVISYMAELLYRMIKVRKVYLNLLKQEQSH